MQLTVSELIKELQKIEAKGAGDKLVTAQTYVQQANAEDVEVIIEKVGFDDDGDVVLGEEQ